MHKRYLIAGLVLLLTLSLAACAGSGTRTTTQPATTEATEAAPTSSTVGEESEPPASTEPAVADTFPAGVKETKKLVVKDLKVGTGPEAAPGSTVVVQYTGWLVDGTKFDSSRDRGQPFSFPLGGGQVIKGWDEGVKGMKAGGKRVLVIPADLGYGAQGAGGVIPPNATLVFVVELVRVQ